MGSEAMDGLTVGGSADHGGPKTGRDKQVRVRRCRFRCATQGTSTTRRRSDFRFAEERSGWGVVVAAWTYLPN
ncbi:hypothetical protein TIFTF001_020153 [Ficus carica]|uniref:Uncharacterized protein n=1 Tax=Ficus carica TaxID=3494 RepID=A0AA88DAR9_FICCA|nr:hypothetical protein TIFTF001_020153 [Ficus carica]